MAWPQIYLKMASPYDKGNQNRAPIDDLQEKVR